MEKVTETHAVVTRDPLDMEHNQCVQRNTGEKLEYNERVHQLFIEFKKAYGSGRREVLYKIL
jgi:hypothetical protein